MVIYVSSDAKVYIVEQLWWKSLLPVPPPSPDEQATGASVGQT